MFKKRTLYILTGLLALILIFSGCKGMSPGGEPEPQDYSETRYLKNNIHTEMRYHRDGTKQYSASYANYIRPPEKHVIVPVNTPVQYRVESGIARTMIYILDTSDGKIIDFEYDPGRMQMSADAYMELITSPTKVRMSGLSGIDRKGINEGRPYEGMSKKGIRMALGYPAKHRTPTLESDTWVYWINRFKTVEIVFGNNDKVVSIRGY